MELHVETQKPGMDRTYFVSFQIVLDIEEIVPPVGRTALYDWCNGLFP